LKTESKVLTLAEVCHVYQPETISKRTLPADGKYPVYGANGQIGFNDKYNHENSELLLGCRGSVGSIHISDPFSWINGNAMVVQPFDGVVTRNYLKYALMGGIDIKRAISGTAQPQITRESLSSIVIPVPPIVSQNKIVEHLDEAMMEVSFLEANTNLTYEIQLTLLKSICDSLLANAENKSTDLGSLAYFENGDRGPNYPNKSMRVDVGIPFINAGHISEGDINFDDMDYISRGTFEKLSRGKVNTDDILFCLRGSLGKVGVVTDFSEGAIASSLVIVRPKPGVSSKYLLMYFMSSLCEGEIAKLRSGTAQPNLGAAQLKTFQVPIVDKKRVMDICDKFESAVSDLRSLKNNLQQSKNHVNDLKDAILLEAFNRDWAI
jgi:type I restriction enzyme S subunit